MHWWDETEARAHRLHGPAHLATTLRRRLTESAHLSPDLSVLPAYGLARLYSAGCDLVQIVDSFLLVADGDGPAVRRGLLHLHAWCGLAAAAVSDSARPFLLLVDSLQLEPGEVARLLRGEDTPEAAAADGGPAEAAKRGSGARPMYTLYERLDLKLESVGMAAPVRAPLARDLSKVYAGFLRMVRATGRLLTDGGVGRRDVVQLLVDVHGEFHLHLGPVHLEPVRLEPGGLSGLGLPARLASGVAAIDAPGTGSE